MTTRKCVFTLSKYHLIIHSDMALWFAQELEAKPDNFVLKSKSDQFYFSYVRMTFTEKSDIVPKVFKLTGDTL